MTERVYLFKGFERFWHWSQATLIIFLLVSGFEIHGTYRLFGFEKAVNYHTIAAWSLVGLWIFAIFWHVTTGEWRQYIPTTQKVLAIANYYSSGIFKGEPHPFKPTSLQKHNPLQRLTYLAVLTLLSPLDLGHRLAVPVLWRLGRLGPRRAEPAMGRHGLHTVGAFLMLAFLISHLYLATTGHKWNSQLKAMVTGWEELS
jgi:thiosulfate reductase cytochrome b subunit